jgi:hypothetical protein
VSLSPRATWRRVRGTVPPEISTECGISRNGRAKAKGRADDRRLRKKEVYQESMHGRIVNNNLHIHGMKVKPVGASASREERVEGGGGWEGWEGSG